MIILDQAHYDDITNELSKLNIRGFTSWKPVYGRGSNTRISALWNSCLALAQQCNSDCSRRSSFEATASFLKELDDQYQNLGLRAFSWNIEDMI